MDYLKDEYGVWAAYGEDTSQGNFMERPQIPFLGYFEGKYEDVSEHVKTLRRWKSWGQGGTVKKIEIKKIELK